MGGGRAALWEQRFIGAKVGWASLRRLGREYTFCTEVNPLWLLWLCWPQAETQLKDIFLKSNVYWGHHIFWWMNSYWKATTYIHLSAYGQYQNKPWSSPGRDLHTGDSLCRVLQWSLAVQVQVIHCSAFCVIHVLFLQLRFSLRKCVEGKVSKRGGGC